MESNRVFRLRVIYGKSGRLALLSHLEISRALERVVRRSNLPFAITQGFSPHMRIGFGHALPVGVGGTEECFDIYLNSYVKCDVALEKLASAAPSDLMPIRCFYIDNKAAAASVAFPYSTYRAVLTEPVAEFVVPDEISVVKKNGEKLLRTCDFLMGAPVVDGAQVEFVLYSSQDGSLRPDVFMKACLDHSGASDTCKVYSLTRISMKESL